MTATADSAAADTQAQASSPRNSFEKSLKLGFHLNGEIPAIVGELRKAHPPDRYRVTIPRRRLMPKTDTPEEKARVRAEVDAQNEARRQQVEEYFSRFLPLVTAKLLSEKAKRLVTGFVIVYCPYDHYFTLMVEHDAF